MASNFETTEASTRHSHCHKVFEQIIDVNHFPIPEAERSNVRHRPIGIEQGMAGTFILMKIPFAPAEAKEVNRRILVKLPWCDLRSIDTIGRGRTNT